MPRAASCARAEPPRSLEGDRYPEPRRVEPGSRQVGVIDGERVRPHEELRVERDRCRTSRGRASPGPDPGEAVSPAAARRRPRSTRNSAPITAMVARTPQGASVRSAPLRTDIRSTAHGAASRIGSASTLSLVSNPRANGARSHQRRARCLPGAPRVTNTITVASTRIAASKSSCALIEATTSAWSGWQAKSAPAANAEAGLKYRRANRQASNVATAWSSRFTAW